MITKTETVEKALVKIDIRWVEDNDTTVNDWLDAQAVHTKNGNVDVQATYDSFTKDGGCTPEQARSQVANYITRYNAWTKGEWTYVGCRVRGFVDVNDSSIEEEGNQSLWGIEGFSDALYATEIENELIDQLRSELEKDGYTISDEEWESIPKEENPSSSYLRPDGDDPAKYTSPLIELPESNDTFYLRYGNKDETLGYDCSDEDCEFDIVAECQSCGEVFRYDMGGVYDNEISTKMFEAELCPNDQCVNCG
jgi:hypothetical protein